MTACALVPVDSDHLDLVRSWILDDELRDLLGTITPPSDVQHRRWFDELQADPTRQTRLIKALPSNDLVGVVGLRDIDLIYRGAELWLYVGDRDHRGEGLGKDAVRALLTFAFDTLGLERVFVRVAAYNPGAHTFFLGVGFTDEGTLRHAVYKQGAFHDMHLLSVLRDEFTAESEERSTR